MRQKSRPTCTDLGVPLAMEKLEGPTHCITFLGIEIDTQAGTLCLPADRLFWLQEVLRHWAPRKACQRCQLECCIGSLQHVCRVIKPGRAFLRWMIDLLRIPGAITTFVSTRSSKQICNGGMHLRDLRRFRSLWPWSMVTEELVPVSVASSSPAVA